MFGYPSFVWVNSKQICLGFPLLEYLRLYIVLHIDFFTTGCFQYQTTTLQTQSNWFSLFKCSQSELNLFFNTNKLANKPVFVLVMHVDAFILTKVCPCSGNACRRNHTYKSSDLHDCVNLLFSCIYVCMCMSCVNVAINCLLIDL